MSIGNFFTFFIYVFNRLLVLLSYCIDETTLKIDWIFLFHISKLQSIKQCYWIKFIYAIAFFICFNKERTWPSLPETCVKSLEIMQCLIKPAETGSGNPNIVIFLLKTDHAMDDLQWLMMILYAIFWINHLKYYQEAWWRSANCFQSCSETWICWDGCFVIYPLKMYIYIITNCS